MENTDIVNDYLRCWEDDQLPDCHYRWFLLDRATRLVLIKWQKSKASFFPLIVGLNLVFNLTELMGPKLKIQ